MLRIALLLIAAMGLPRLVALSAEPLPPRALARIGDHRLYHGPWITRASLSPDGRRIASAAFYPDSYKFTEQQREAYNRIIVLWDAATGERLHELRVPEAPISWLAFSPDGKRIASDYHISDKRYGFILFDVETGKRLRCFEQFKSEKGSQTIERLAFSGDGKQLRVSEEGGPITAWGAATGELVHLWKPPAARKPGKNTEGVSVVRGVMSPDGKRIVWEMRRFREGAFQGRSIELRVHDVETAKLLYRKDVPLSDQLGCLAFSLNGHRFTAKADNTIFVWDTASGKVIHSQQVPNLISFVLTANGRQAVIEQRSNRLRLWDLKTGKPVREIYPGYSYLNNIYYHTPQAISADGKTLLAATDSTLRLFDVDTGKEHSFPSHRVPVMPRFSDDGRTLFTGCDETRCSWDLSSKTKPALLHRESRKTWEIQHRIVGSENIYCLAHSADERLFVDRPERSRVRLRETASGRILHEWKYDKQEVVVPMFSPDATRLLFGLAAVKPNFTLVIRPEFFWLYDVKAGTKLAEFKAADLSGLPVFSLDGRLLAWADHTRAAHIHDAVSGNAIRTLRSTRLPPQTAPHNAEILFSPDGTLLFVTSCVFPEESGAIAGKRIVLPMSVFRISSGREMAHFYANPEKTDKAGPITCMACSPDNRLLAAAEEESGTIRILEIASGKVRVEFAGHRHGVHGLAFSPDGKILASGGKDNVVFLWDVTGAQIPEEDEPRHTSKTNTSAKRR